MIEEIEEELEADAAPGNEILITIEDAGPGIPQDEINLVFDPFYRGTNSRREQGFGLGLSMVKSIINAHG